MLSGILAGIVLTVVVTALGFLGQRVPAFVHRRSRAWATLAWAGSLVGAVLVFVACVAGLGPAGVPVGLLAAILVFELMFASVALELWAQGAYLRMHKTVLDKHPDAEEKLKASRIGRIIAKRRG